MKRFLALLLTLVMLVSVCGLQAFAADGDTPADTGDELVVYTRSGATRTFHVGDTFSYTYWFRLTSGSVNEITGHVLYDSQCLSVNADGCKFPNMTSPSTKNNAGDFEFHDTFTTSQGGEFATTSPQTMANISFTVTRGGTAYLTTLLEELEIRKSNGDKSQLVTNFKNKSWSPTMYSTFDYLQDEKPSLASTPLSASSDVAWFYAVDAETGAPIPAGVTFELTGTSDNGKHIERTAVSDAYGFVGFGTVPYGKSYYIQTRTASDASVAYIIKDGARILPDVENGKLRLDHTLHYKTADPSELRSITVTFEWTNEQIAPDEVYTKDRPTSVYMELSRNNDAVVVAHHSSDPEDGQAVFDNLPIHDDYGNEITYVLTTTTLQHYDAQITRTDTGFHINFAYLNDHNWETTRTEPTCTVDGSIVSVCKDCGATDRVVLPMTGHKLVSSGHDATCTQDGYQRYMCTQCDYWYEKKTPALGHDWSDWDVLLEAGSKRDGIKQRTCMRCGEVETYAIPSDHHEHTMKKHVVQPTCTEQGYTRYTCACGDTYIEESSYVPALGHAWAETARQEPTSKTVGVITYTCQRCAKLRYEFLPKTEPVETWKNPYRDVRSTAWYYEDVAYVTQNKLMVGTSTMMFSPNAVMSRAMLVTVLYRMNGSPSVAGMTAPFTDVPSGQWYTDAVIWAYNCGVVDGTSPTQFAPAQNVTREQMTKMFYGYAEFMDYNTMAVADLSAFADGGSVSSWAQTMMGWAVANSLIKGVQDENATYLRPQGVATRAEAAAILHRFDQWRVNAVVTGK